MSLKLSPASNSQTQVLISRAQAGDPVAFQQLVEPHLGAVRRMAYSFVKDWTDADDLAQDSLLKAFRAFPAYRGQASISTWLFAVTRSVCLDWFKTRQSKLRLLEGPLDLELEDELESAELLTEYKVGAEQLWSAIRRLKVEFRMPLVLFDIEGLSYEDIARVERVKVGTVRSRLSRARAQLAVALRTEEPDVIAFPGTDPLQQSSSPLAEPAE